MNSDSRPDLRSDLLVVQGLRLGYGRNDVLHGMDLRVPQGAIVSLIGANGAGKSTTMRGISGLLRPRAGSILFAGDNIAGWPPHRIVRRGLVQVPEGRQVFANMTVAENLAAGAWLVSNKAEAHRRLDGALARFPRLAERLSQPAGTLSGGEQQMLAIGRALMAQPKLLLLDEPSMGLAPMIVAEIFEIILKIRAQGSTILLVEQNARAALAIADYCYVVESGTIALEGTGAEIAQNPAVMAAYLGI
jgi:branched-chain amino acid transport system ATP-binding protein